MTKSEEISKKEKKLLNILGGNAHLSYKEILTLTEYKREEIVSKKIKKLRELDIIRGPYYDINLSAVGTNQIYNIYADITYNPENRDTVFTILKTIPGMRWVFPVQQEDRFFIQIQCNHYSLTGRLLTFLQNKKLLEYWMTASKNRWIKMNPDFFGSPIPDTTSILAPCTLPDLSYPSIKPKVKWNKADLIFMQYLQAETEAITRIRDMEYKVYKRFWRYGEIQNSLRKIKASGILQSKDFHISPYPRNRCCTFLLLLKAPQEKSLLRVLHNFGQGCRIHKSYTVAGDIGFLFCWASTEIVPEIVALFDEIENITIKQVYYLRMHTDKYLYGLSFEPELFDIEKQKWTFPYLNVKKEIEKIIDKK